MTAREDLDAQVSSDGGTDDVAVRNAPRAEDPGAGTDIEHLVTQVDGVLPLEFAFHPVGPGRRSARAVLRFRRIRPVDARPLLAARVVTDRVGAETFTDEARVLVVGQSPTNVVNSTCRRPARARGTTADLASAREPGARLLGLPLGFEVAACRSVGHTRRIIRFDRSAPIVL